MRQRLLSTLCAIVVLWGSAEAVELHDRFRTFTRELLKSEYLNDWQDDTAAKINELVAFHPADSTKSGTATHDTLAANGDAQITTMDPLVSLSASDSLKFHRANIDRAHLDTLFVGPVPATAPSWAVGVTAGHQSHFSYADTDTLNADSLTVAGPAVFDGAVNLNSTFSIGTTAVTATATEINLIDGVTATTAELNILDGVTSTADELNILDGVTSSATEINLLTGVTSLSSGVTYDQNIVKLDTTISSAGTNGGGGYKVITGSLLNWDDNCVGGNRWLGRWDCSGSYEAWREKEKSTSWYQAARGDTSAQFPTNYAITISTGQDSIVIWNRDTAELWMAFKQGPDNSTSTVIGYNSGNLTDIDFKDGLLYFTDDSAGFTQWPVGVGDFLTDRFYGWYTAGKRVGTEGGIQNRNNDGAYYYGAGGSGIANSAVTAVAVVRDPFGLTDVNGAPKHWWGVQTAADEDLYDPHSNSITNRASGVGGDGFAISKRGELTAGGNAQSQALIAFSAFRIPQQGFTNNGGWGDGNSPPFDLAWTSASSYYPAWGQQNRWFGNATTLHLAGNEGAYRTALRSVPNSNGREGWRQRFSSTVNAPVEFGDAVLTLALEDNTTDSSPYANTMTATNGGTVSAVFDNGYSGCVGCYLEITGQAEFNLNATDFGVSYWFKTTQNPTTAGIHFSLRYVSGSQLLHVTNQTDGKIAVLFSDDGGSTTDGGTSNADLSDNQWHHVAITRDSEVFSVYFDGVLDISNAISNTSGTNFLTDRITIGANIDPPSNGGYTYETQIDEFMLSSDAPLHPDAIAKIHAEGRKQINRGGSPINRDHLHAADVDYVDALDNGIWLAGNEDSLTVFGGRLALQTYGTSLGAAGTIKDAKLVQNAGTDSVGVIIVTATETILIQPDVNLEKMASSSLYHKEPILIGETVVVDSAGVDGIFWDITDGIDAAANASRQKVSVKGGTYGAFSLTNASNMSILGQAGGFGAVGGGVSVFGNATKIGGPTLTSAAVTNSGTVARVELGYMIFENDDGGGASNADCVTLTPSGSYFHDLYAANCDGDGMEFNGSWNTFVNLFAASNDNVGIRIDGDTNQGNRLTGGIINGNGSYGISWHSDDGIVDGVLMRNNGSYQLYIESTSDGLLYTGMRWEANTVNCNSCTNSTAGTSNGTAW